MPPIPVRTLAARVPRSPAYARQLPCADPASLILSLERHADHWRWVGGPVPPGADAITLGPLICLRRSAAGSERLLRHELVHVAQWRRYGAIGFLRRYLGAYCRARLRGYSHLAAYRRIPLEVEAEWIARRSGRL